MIKKFMYVDSHRVFCDDMCNLCGAYRGPCTCMCDKHKVSVVVCVYFVKTCVQFSFIHSSKMIKKRTTVDSHNIFVMICVSNMNGFDFVWAIRK